MPEIVIRPAVAADLPGVADIYAYESLHAWSTFETEPRPLAAWAEKLDSGEAFLVAVEDGTVLGYAYAGPFRDRPAYHRTRETSVYVHRDARGRKVGRLLYDALLPALRQQGRHTAVALIALPNDASVRLHEQSGFVHAGTMCEVGDKLGRLIDVAIYQAML